MGGICRRLALVTAAVVFAAGCAGEALGPEYREVGALESGVQFYAPGLDGGYRKFITGHDEQFVNRTIALYGPRRGEYPRGQLILIETPPDQHFTRLDPPQDMLEYLSEFEDRTIRRGPSGAAVNAIGRVRYAALLADDLSCVVFRQAFGTLHDAGLGTRLLEGYYCRGAAPMMTEAEAEAIVKAVGHREFGALEPPAGWSDAGGDGSADSGVPGAAALIRSAEAYLRADEYDQAIRDFTQAIRLDPESADAFRGRGIAWRLKRDYDRAIRDFDAVIRLDPDDPIAYFGRGIAHWRKGDYDRAIRDFDTVIRLDPDEPDAYYRRALAHADRGDDGRAIADFTAAIRLGPDEWSRYFERGLAYRRTADEARAMADFGEAARLVGEDIRRDPGDAAAFNNRCWIYGIMRRPAEALADCNESLRLRPDGAATLDSRALAYWLLGEHDRARGDLRRAREIDPDFMEGRDRFREFEEMFRPAQGGA